MTTKLTDTQRTLLHSAVHTNEGRITSDLIKTAIPQCRGGAASRVITALGGQGLVAYDELGCFVTPAGYEAVGCDQTEQPTPVAAILPPDAAESRKTRAQSKQATVIRMLQRPEGVTITEICAETNWQQHTARGFLAGAVKKRLGLSLASRKDQGSDRRYYIA